MVVPVMRRKGLGEIPADAWYTNVSNLAFHSHGLKSLFSLTVTISALETGINLSSWGAHFRMVRLAGDHS